MNVITTARRIRYRPDLDLIEIPGTGGPVYLHPDQIPGVVESLRASNQAATVHLAHHPRQSDLLTAGG